MRNRLQKYFSFFCLFLLFFPMAEQQLHALEHLKEVHCNSTDKHFHTLQHDCSICDYTASESTGNSHEEVVYRTTESRFHYLPFSESLSKPSAFQDLPTRAPPVI